MFDKLFTEIAKDLGLIDPRPKIEILKEKYENGTANKREIRVYSKMVEKTDKLRGVRMRIDAKISGFDETVEYFNYLLKEKIEIPEEHKFLLFCLAETFPYLFDHGSPNSQKP